MKNVGRLNLRALIGFIALCVSPVVLAWDGIPVGVPGSIDVAQGTGLGFRVHFSPAVSMCGNSNVWAYLNTTDINYSTSVATIMMAKAQGLSVVLYTTADTNGYCHIGYISLQ